MKLKIPKYIFGNPVEGALERALADVQSPPQNPPQGDSPAGIQVFNDYWSITGVQYKGDFYVIDLSKSLLENGAVKTQDEWADLYSSAKSNNGFHTPDYPLFYGILRTLYAERNNSKYAAEIAKTQKFLKDTSRARWLMNLSRIKYQPKGKGDDIIMHNYGTPDEYQRACDFIGNDEWVKDTTTPIVYSNLLVSSDSPQQINNVFQWLNDTDAYLCRVNSRSKKKVDERVVWFYADSGRAVLNCYWDPSYSNSSLGVRVARKI